MNDLVEIRFASENKGRGVFAKKNIKKGNIIEKAHVIPIPNKDYELLENTFLYNYTFEWADPKDNGEFKHAMVLSFCEFVNHSFDPNLKYVYDYKKKLIKFIAIKNIKSGEELTVNYNGRVDDKSPVWFEVE